MLTRKHFKSVAELVRQTPAVRVEDVMFFANLMADYLAKQNPRFNRAKFLKACGVV